MIRPFIFSDIPHVLQIEKENFSNPWTKEQFEQDLLSNPQSRNLVYEKQNKILAYLISYQVLDELHITNIAVLERVKRQGIAETLLSYAIRQNQYKMLFLEVNENNLAAINLYRKFGFQYDAKRANYYEDGSDALLMSKKV